MVDGFKIYFDDIVESYFVHSSPKNNHKNLLFVFQEINWVIISSFRNMPPSVICIQFTFLFFGRALPLR